MRNPPCTTATATDASLVWLAVHAGVREILTLDTGDFATFRTPPGKPFKDLLAVKRMRR